VTLPVPTKTPEGTASFRHALSDFVQPSKEIYMKHQATIQAAIAGLFALGLAASAVLVSAGAAGASARPQARRT